jgi:hypothetical protein
MRTSTEAAAVSDALVKASLLLTNPAKTQSAEIPGKDGRRGFSYTYAGLAAILDEVRPVLQAHGLALVQEAAEANVGVGITTRLVHSSGEWIEYGPLVIPCAADARAIGSATTYGRRYQLCAALGIAADDDDDDGRIASPAPRASVAADSSPTAGNEAQRASAGDPPASDPEPVSAPDPLGGSGAGATSEGVAAGYGEGSRPAPSDTPFQRVKLATGSAAKARAAINRVCDLEYTARTVINATDEEADITIAALAEAPLPRGKA